METHLYREIQKRRERKARVSTYFIKSKARILHKLLVSSGPQLPIPADNNQNQTKEATFGALSALSMVFKKKEIMCCQPAMSWEQLPPRF